MLVQESVGLVMEGYDVDEVAEGMLESILWESDPSASGNDDVAAVLRASKKRRRDMNLALASAVTGMYTSSAGKKAALRDLEKSDKYQMASPEEQKKMRMMAKLKGRLKGGALPALSTLYFAKKAKDVDLSKVE